ncbi:hypothetical protein SAMN06265346_11025 [Flavobacterium hercynium]|uniref:Uncharacterized protein n=1 Tax=Flavobacterium hercynium TaxID=387094 RepID=A0A226GXY0_9FLAO|nr:hypothetical protein B0A66_17445 [Flavobacterium hercynium]SMP26980.1 hypothetical protein SAMN06265346_11025 [Flavobacterium hercynium]
MLIKPLLLTELEEKETAVALKTNLQPIFRIVKEKFNVYELAIGFFHKMYCIYSYLCLNKNQFA